MKKIGLIAAIIVCLSSAANSEVLTGPISGLPESSVNFSWGDGVHNLQSFWSAHNVNSSGYVYGTNWSDSTADVYAFYGNIYTVSNASVFSYTTGSLAISEGSCVVFRGKNGYYGAWIIDNIYPYSDPGGSIARMDGQWYFQNNGTANFTPEPATLLLLGLGGIMLRKK